MPTTINGIGTTYYGKANLREYAGVCDSCGSHTALSDYETGHYFVLLFIPIIPLGKKQIIGECSSCQVHRAMALTEWERMREEAIDTGLLELAEDPKDAGKAIALLSTFTVFNRLDEAIELAGSTRTSFDGDVDAQIAIGSWYEQQGMSVDAEQCFQHAVAIDPEYPPCLRISAIDAMEAGKPEEAAEKLESLRPESEYYDPSLFVMLARAFQASEQHDKALEEFAGLFEHIPDLAKDKEIRKLVKASEKSLGHVESILPKKGLFG